MKIKDFVEKAIKQDKRNRCEKSVEIDSFVPDSLMDFYQKANPVDVEISMEGNAVKLYPTSDLEDLQSDYSLGSECFVFATCNSDPIFVYKDKKIYTCYHGTTNAEKELMANSFSEFLDLID